MIRAQKFVFLTVLTFLMYGFGLFLDVDFFIVPFPLFDFVLLWGIVRYLLEYYKSIQSYHVLFLIAVIFSVLTNQVLISSVLSNAQIANYSNIGIFDISRCIALFFYVLSFLMLIRNSDFYVPWYLTLLYVILSIGSLFGSLFWALLLISLMPIIILEVKAPKATFKWMWYLKLALDFMTVPMLLYTK
jgi:hypothetical protein